MKSSRHLLTQPAGKAHEAGTERGREEQERQAAPRARAAGTRWGAGPLKAGDQLCFRGLMYSHVAVYFLL